MVRVAAIAAFFLAAVSPILPGQASVPPIAQRHVLTADYFGEPYGSTSVTPALAAPFLTWAQVSVPNANATAAAGIKTQYYIDPMLTIANRGGQMYTSDESTFAHDCLGRRVTIPYRELTENLMAPERPSLRAVFARYVKRITSVVHYDALFEDDATPPSEYLRFRLMPCGYKDDDWLRALDGLNQSSPIPVILNGLNATKRPMPSGLLALVTSPKTLGLNYESCYAGYQQTKVGGTVWDAMENSELAVVATGKMFECMARDGADAATSIDRREYVYASFLLGYDPATSVIWEEYATPSKFRVEPESQLVALDALPRLPRRVSDLQTAGGTYARRFARCYIRGNFVGACAAVVNTDASAHPFPFSGYDHTMVLQGGGVLDGGTIAVDGPPPPHKVAPLQGIIAFRSR